MISSARAFFNSTARPGQYLAGPFLFQWIIEKMIYFFFEKWKKMLVIETTTIIIKTISIPMIQNTIKVSFLNYLIFFLFQFYSIYFTGIKKKERMEPYILAQFYVLAYIIEPYLSMSKHPHQKTKKCYLVI